jgi:hypothetical protein
MKIRFQNKHKGSESCAEYTLNIYDELYIGDAPEAAFEIEAPGFERSFTPQTSIVTSYGIITSEVSFNIDVQPGEVLLDNFLRNILPLAQENRFHLEVLRGSSVVFRGTLMTDQFSIQADCAPYNARLSFTDGLSLLQGFKNYPPLGFATGTTPRLKDDRVIIFIQSILRNVANIKLWVDDEDFIISNCRWFDEELDNQEDPLFQTYLSPTGIIYEIDADSDPEIVSGSLYDQLNIILKGFQLRLFQDRGVWHVLQGTSYTLDLLTFWKYNRVSVFTGPTSQDDSLFRQPGGSSQVAYATDLQVDPEQGFPYRTEDAVITYKPALKEVVVTLDDELREAELLRQTVRSLADPPDHPESRANTWFPMMRVQALPNATVRLHGRARFYVNSAFNLPNRPRVPYMRIEARIDGVAAYSSAVLYGVYQNWTRTSNNDPQNPSIRHEYLIEFDFDFINPIPAFGLMEIRVVGEGTLEDGPGSVISNFAVNFMDIRVYGNIIPILGFGNARLLEYRTLNSRSNLATSAVYDVTTTVGDVLFEPTVAPSGYLDRGGLFLPISTFPFRKYLGRWQFDAQGSSMPICSLFGNRLMSVQNLPVQSIQATIVGDVWFLRNYLLYNGRRFIFDGGSFTSFEENWNVTITEIMMDPGTITVNPVLVREPLQGDERNTGQLTIPPLDTNRFGQTAVTAPVAAGEPVFAINVNLGSMTAPPSAGNMVLVDPTSGLFVAVPILGMPASSGAPENNEWEFAIDFTFDQAIQEGVSVYFDAEAINSIMPQIIVGTTPLGNLRRIVIEEEDETMIIRLQTLEESYAFSVTPTT